MANAMFYGQPEERGLLPVSWTMRAALAITAFATLFIGIMPRTDSSTRQLVG